MEPVGNAKSTLSIYPALLKKTKVPVKDDTKKDTIEISNTSKAFAKLDKFLNLGSPDRLDTDDLNPSEKQEFLKTLSELLKRGVVGYEILVVNGIPEKHYLENEIGDHRLQGAKLYKKYM